MLKRGYKALTLTNEGHLVSFCAYPDTPAQFIRDAGYAFYHPGKSTVPPRGGGPLAVFNTLNSALDYLLGRNRVEQASIRLWEVDYVPVSYRILWRTPHLLHVRRQVSDYPEWPAGTDFARRVTLLRELPLERTSDR